MRLSPNFFPYRKYNVQDLRINLYFVHPYYERTLEKVGEELREEGDGKRREEENNRGSEGEILMRWDMAERRKPRWERERSKERR
jgi:hypothetical protein